MVSRAPLVRLHDLWAFYLLTFLFLGLLPAFAFVFNDGSLDFSRAAASASGATGIPWTSNLVNVLRLARVEPVLLVTLLGSLAPTLAAIAVLLYLRKPALWTAFASRFRFYPERSLVKALQTYAGIFALLIPVLFLIFEIRNSLGAGYSRTVPMNAYLFGPLLTIAFLDQGALLEEVGWRGFACPELQRLLDAPLGAAFLVGICWGLWHIPRDVTTGVIDRLGLATYVTLYLPAFLAGTISVSIIASYFMNKLGGSIIPAIIVHGITNDAIGISGHATIVDALTPFHQATKNLPLAVVATGIILLARRSLGVEADQVLSGTNRK